MSFSGLVKARESCREYSSKPVPRELLVRIIDTARLAPSACNLQPWHFTVVQTPELVSATAKCLQGMGMNRFTDEVPAFIVISENALNIAETAADLVSGRRYAQLDVGIAAAHIILAAKEARLDTCIIGWFNEKKLRQALQLDSRYKVSLVIAIGYSKNPTATPRVKKRKSFDEVATFL